MTPSKENNPSVIVIGGGVVGGSCAYFLSNAGYRVTVVDQGRFGGGCSHGNCGYVCPSHVLPMAEPGAVAGALKAMFSRNSPFSIKPRWSPSLWGWLANFARRCNEHDMLSAAYGIRALLDSSMALYREMAAHRAIVCEFETRGLLYAYRDASKLDAYTETNRLLSETFGHPAVRYDGDAILDLEPALRPGLAGGWFYPDDAHLRPDALMRSLRSTLESSGVSVLEGVEVTGFATAGERAAALQTRAGPLRANWFVVATGAWTPRLARQLGCTIPIQPGKGYSITMPRPSICPNIPMIFPETRVAVTPWASGYRLGSTMEFAGYDTTMNRARLNLLRDGSAPYLREAFSEPVQEEWYGWRPMTYDSLPIIGPSPIMRNVMIAAGHNMVGISMAPATGKLVAELITGQPTHVDPAPYRPTRF